ncbi:MAG: alpha/beta hydrolase [Halobacteriovoraceae bacterium]|nr:alpha/beta hydrolase [Halobacteriovoraceae bacterium]MCB9095688.1 alpha/beta hydrolase [Halobacteriovoraceae bacterium]
MVNQGYNERDLVSWFPSYSRPRGLFIVTHGLNFYPIKMFQVIKLLNTQRFDVALVSLAGHRLGTNIEEVTGDIWIKEMREALSKAHQIALKKDYSISFLGFSTGALILQYVLSKINLHVERQILLAPALEIKWLSQLPRAFTLIDGKTKLKSFSPLPYRYNQGTSLNAYRALFEIYDKFHKTVNYTINIPTQVYIRKEDELLSYRSLVKFIKKQDLDLWEVHFIEKNPDISWQHLIVDRESMGENQWVQFEENIKKFLIS